MRYFIAYSLKSKQASQACIGFANAVIDVPKEIIDEDGLTLATELINQELKASNERWLVAVIISFQKLAHVGEREE